MSTINLSKSKVTTLDIIKSNQMRKIFEPNIIKYSEEYFKEKRMSAQVNQEPQFENVNKKIVDIQK